MLTNLFVGLREHAIASSGLETADRLIPFESIQSLRSYENGDTSFSEALDEAWLDYFSAVLDFPNPYAEFAATKNCTPGKSYACKSTCITVAKNCRNPLPGQAQTYAAFLAMQSGGGATAATPTPVVATSPPKKTTATQVVPPVTSPATNLVSPIKTNTKELDDKRNYLVKQFGQKTVDAAEQNVQKILNDPDTNVHVRVGSTATLELILDDRFKTAHELGRTDHDIPFLQDDYLTARGRVESKTLGYDGKTPDSDRPIYGYLGGKDLNGTSHQDVAQAYGSITVRLKPEVKDRSTFTGSDSFKSGIASEVKNDGTPPPPNAASLVSSTRHGYDKDKLPNGYPKAYADKSGDGRQLVAASKAKTIDDLTPALTPTGNRYIEAQVHGKVTPKDIAEIHFQPKGTSDRPSAKVAQFAKDNGVDLYVGGKKLSPQDLDDLISPPKSKRSQRLQDMDAALKSGDFGKVADIAEKIHDDAQKLKLAPGEQDAILKQLYQDAGYDGKPQIKSKKDMDALAQSGATMMVRGITSPPASSKAQADQFADQFRSGDYFTGNGIYGNGTYVGHSGSFSPDGLTFIPGGDAKSHKRTFNDVAKHGYIKPDRGGATLRMSLSNDAVVVTAFALSKQIDDTKNKINAWEAAEKQKIISQSADPVQLKKDTDSYKRSLDITKAVAGTSRTSNRLGTQTEYTIPHKNKKYGADLKVQIVRNGFGIYSFIDSNGKAVSSNSNSLNTVLQKARWHFASEDAKSRNSYSGAATKLQQIQEKADKMRVVLGVHPTRGDLGNRTSGRFAVANGIDAIALNNSYEPNTFMNLLNRSKVIVQDTNLKFTDGQKKGVGV